VNHFTEIIQSKPDGELLKMVYAFDEWSPEMLSAVEAELLKRNILPDDIQSRKKVLIQAEKEQLITGKQASLFGQIIGWLTVFGLFGIGIGYHYAFSKVRSKYTQDEYFKYNESSRKNGSYLFYTSLLLTSALLLYRMLEY